MELRPVEDHEIHAYRLTMQHTFGGDPAEDPDGDQRYRDLIEPGRGFAAFDGPTIVATASMFTNTLHVPGGAVPMAGLTMVTVRPTHRRRGLLRGLIDLHLADARRRGEPVSGLWASEGAIYGRFGYGVACEGDDITFDARGLTITVPGGEADRVDLVDDTEAARAMPALFDRAIQVRPGTFVRTPAWWTHRRFRDRAELRHGASPRRFAIARRDDVATGWIIFRQKLEWRDGVADGALVIEELGGLDGRAEATLWQFACGVDLFPNVSFENAPVDSILPWIVSDARRIRRRRTDTLWLRPDDIAALLTARRYAGDGVVRLGLDDATWELAVDGAARCTRTDAQPDLRLDRAALGSLYLGGVSATTLARAGRLTGDDAALAACDRIFRWPVAPWCQEMF